MLKWWSDIQGQKRSFVIVTVTVHPCGSVSVSDILVSVHVVQPHTGFFQVYECGRVFVSPALLTSRENLAQKKYFRCVDADLPQSFTDSDAISLGKAVILPWQLAANSCQK